MTLVGVCGLAGSGKPTRAGAVESGAAAAFETPSEAELSLNDRALVLEQH